MPSSLERVTRKFRIQLLQSECPICMNHSELIYKGFKRKESDQMWVKPEPYYKCLHCGEESSIKTIIDYRVEMEEHNRCLD